jgi:importin subunit alpha-1
VKLTLLHVVPVPQAITNATSGGNHAQIRYLASQGVIPPLCKLFDCPDSKIIMVAMEGVENILRVGKEDADVALETSHTNPYAVEVENCGGLHGLEALQQHDSVEIKKKAVQILLVSHKRAVDGTKGGEGRVRSDG